jgi:hypothetical protein
MSGTAVASWSGFTDLPDWSTFISTNASTYRVVSFGVRLFTTASNYTASGTVHVFTVDGYTGFGSSIYPDIASDNYAEIARYPLIGHQSVWFSKPNDVTANNYISVSPGATENSWSKLIIGVTGAPASTVVLGIEIVANIECTPKWGTTMARMASPAAPHDITVEESASTLRSHLPSSIQGSLTSFGNTIVRAAQGALRQAALDTVAKIPMIGGSLRKGAEQAMIMDLN